MSEVLDVFQKQDANYRSNMARLCGHMESTSTYFSTAILQVAANLRDKKAKRELARIAESLQKTVEYSQIVWKNRYEDDAHRLAEDLKKIN